MLGLGGMQPQAQHAPRIRRDHLERPAAVVDDGGADLGHMPRQHRGVSDDRVDVAIALGQPFVDRLADILELGARIDIPRAAIQMPRTLPSTCDPPPPGETEAGSITLQFQNLESAAQWTPDPYAGSKPSRAILSFHTSGASWWTFAPEESTATVTGKSTTSNS